MIAANTSNCERLNTSLNFVVNRFLTKLFNIIDINTVWQCSAYFKVTSERISCKLFWYGPAYFVMLFCIIYHACI